MELEKREVKYLIEMHISNLRVSLQFFVHVFIKKVSVQSFIYLFVFKLKMRNDEDNKYHKAINELYH